MSFSNTKKAFLWSGIGKFSQYSISFIINILLARLLTPEIFGLIGVLTIFIIISSILIESGFRDALIRKKEVSNLEYTSVFYFNVGISIVIYILLFLAAPLIADFYQEPILKELSRWLFLPFIINALSLVQTVVYEKELDFKTLSKVSVLSALIGGMVGVIIAYYGFGVWALVSSTILTALLRTLFLWYNSSWRPELKYDQNVIKELFSFSSKILLSGLFAQICANISQLVIGKVYSIVDVGYYDRALTLQRIPMTSISDVINQVSYPMLVNNDANRQEVFYILVKIISFISAPFFLFLIILANPIVTILLTERWLSIVPYFQLLCIYGIFYPLSVLNTNILKIYGLSNLILKNEILRNLLLLLSILISYKFGVLFLVIGVVTVNTLFPFKTFYDLDKKVYNGAFMHYIKNIFEFMLYSLIAAGVIYFLDNLYNYLIINVLFQLLVGVCIYFLLIYLFNRSTLIEIVQKMKIN